MPEQSMKHDSARPNESERRWVSTREAARQLSMHPQTLRKMATAGLVPALRKGSHFVFDLEAVAAALTVKP